MRDTTWATDDVFGASCMFESPDAEFTELGIRVTVLEPGQPNGLYHGEETQEDFLVLAGECLLLVEGEERRLQSWDFFQPHPEPTTSSWAPETGPLSRRHVLGSEASRC